MITQKDGVKLLNLQFPQTGNIKKVKLSASLNYLAQQVDEAITQKAPKTVSRVFDIINYLVNCGSDSVKRIVYQSFFLKLKSIPVNYQIKQGALNNYHIHYRLFCQDKCWLVKSINIES
mgnify:CR=1 FL=1